MARTIATNTRNARRRPQVDVVVSEEWDGPWVLVPGTCEVLDAASTPTGTSTAGHGRSEDSHHVSPELASSATHFYALPKIIGGMVDSRDRRTRVFDELAVVGKAFGSAKRLELVELLAQGERTVDGLARTAGMGVTTVSAHLQVLKMANLVHTRREGTKVHYRLAGDDVASLYDAMRTIARERSADVGQALDAYLNVPGSDEVGLVSRAELSRLLDGKVIVLDVRPEEEFVAGHIPGARSAPLGSLKAMAAELRDAPDVVTYCRGSFCVMAHDAVRLLGAEDVRARRLEDGMLEWRTHGHPVTAGAS